MEAGIIIMLLLFAAAMVCGLVSEGINSWGKSKHGEENWKRMQAAVIAEEERKKYNNYMLTCPVCGSKKILKISDVSRATSVAVWGIASSKLGKQYECSNCNHKW